MDQSLCVEIAYAKMRGNTVKFAVYTKTSLPDFAKSEFSVVRCHEEFIWLRDCLERNEPYAGYIIPPAPAKPNLFASLERMQKLQERQDTMTKEEYSTTKQELEEECRKTLKHSANNHQAFLRQLANHSVFKSDSNFRMFLQRKQELPFRNTKLNDKFKGLFSKITDSIPSKTQKQDDYLECERKLLVKYEASIRDTGLNSIFMSRKLKDLSKSFDKICSSLLQPKTIFTRYSEIFDKISKMEGEAISNEELKFCDIIRCYTKDFAPLDRLLRLRKKYLSEHQERKESLEKQKNKNRETTHDRDIVKQMQCQKFDTISENVKQELQDLNTRKIPMFKKHLVELTQFQLKHANETLQSLESCLMSLREEH